MVHVYSALIVNSHIEILRLKIDELNLKIYKLENEVENYKANEMRVIEQTSSRAKFKNIKNTTTKPAPEKLQKVSKSPEPPREKPLQQPRTAKVQPKTPIVPELPRKQPTLPSNEVGLQSSNFDCNPRV